MNPSDATLRYLTALNEKFGAFVKNGTTFYYRFTVEPGQRFDRLVVQMSLREGDFEREQRSCHGFVDKTNDCLLKSGGWKTPAKIRGYYLPKYDLSTEAGLREAIFNADPYGSYLYDSYKIKEPA